MYVFNPGTVLYYLYFTKRVYVHTVLLVHMVHIDVCVCLRIFTHDGTYLYHICFF